MKKIHITPFFFTALVFLTPVLASAQTPMGSAFREYVHIPATAISIKVPTVIELPVDSTTFAYPVFLVQDVTGDEQVFLGNYFRRSVSVVSTPLEILAPKDTAWNLMRDGKYDTYASFPVPESGAGSVMIELTSAKPLTASTLSVLLDNEVALPTSVLLQADTSDGGANAVVLNTSRMTGNTIRFPKTTSTHWKVTFTYSQPLRITELQMGDDNAEKETIEGVRFLATPGHAYRVYMNPDRYVSAQENVREAGDLITDKGVMRIAKIAPIPNPEYVIADSDKDGVPDISDNCVLFSNAEQVDVNQNGIGDTCEDFDRDGIINARDNCPNNPNVAQTDTDGDNAGDACDTEESRITEKNSWLPWAGMGFALVVVVVLLAVSLRSKGSRIPSDPTPPPTSGV